MSKPGDFNYLCGTNVSFDDPVPRSWFLEELLSEYYYTVSPREKHIHQYSGWVSYANNDEHIPYAALKFSCDNTADSQQKALMRIYIQIPDDGTIAQSPSVRRQRAVAQREHQEETFMRELDRKGCQLVSTFLNFRQSNRDSQEGCIPGGYINHLVWTMVSGKPIDKEQFWVRNREYRDMVRERFCQAHEEINTNRWSMMSHHTGKLIFDEETKSFHICGSCQIQRMNDREHKPFDDPWYAAWGLVEPAPTNTCYYYVQGGRW